MKIHSTIILGMLTLTPFYTSAQQQLSIQDSASAGTELRDIAEQLNLDHYRRQNLPWLNNSLNLENYEIPFHSLKPEQFIPPKYAGEERDKITELFQQLQFLCPDCKDQKNIHVEPINNYGPVRQSSTSLSTNIEIQDTCSVPDWLRQKRGDLTVYSVTRDIPYPEKGCERETISALIDNVVKNIGK